MKRQQRRLELGVERNASETELSLALSPVLTCGYYSESLSQSVSARVPHQRSTRGATPPPRTNGFLPPQDEGVVIQAGMSFVLGQRKIRSSQSLAAMPSSSANFTGRRSVRQHFRPVPAHAMADTSSADLTRSIREFLGRTDHVMNEWIQLGREDGSGLPSVKRSRSSTRSVPLNHSTRRYSVRSLSSSRYSDVVEQERFRQLRGPSFQSLVDESDPNDKSNADTDFGSCQDLNEYDEVKTLNR